MSRPQSVWGSVVVCFPNTDFPWSANKLARAMAIGEEINSSLQPQGVGEEPRMVYTGKSSYTSTQANTKLPLAR